jgi:hypothetical protein
VVCVAASRRREQRKMNARVDARDRKLGHVSLLWPDYFVGGAKFMARCLSFAAKFAAGKIESIF